MGAISSISAMDAISRSDQPSTPTTPTNDTVYDSPRPSVPSSRRRSGTLKVYTTPADNWDSQTLRSPSDNNSFQSPDGSRVYLIHGDQGDGSPGPSGASTPRYEGESPVGIIYNDDSEKGRPDAPFHIFSSRKKKTLMYLAAIAGMFSSLSANIYFPALGQISRVSRTLKQ